MNWYKTASVNKTSSQVECTACLKIKAGGSCDEHHWREFWTCGQSITCRCSSKKIEVNHNHGCGFCKKCESLK